MSILFLPWSVRIFAWFIEHLVCVGPFSAAHACVFCLAYSASRLCVVRLAYSATPLFRPCLLPRPAGRPDLLPGVEARGPSRRVRVLVTRVRDGLLGVFPHAATAPAGRRPRGRAAEGDARGVGQARLVARKSAPDALPGVPEGRCGGKQEGGGSSLKAKATVGGGSLF